MRKRYYIISAVLGSTIVTGLIGLTVLAETSPPRISTNLNENSLGYQRQVFQAVKNNSFTAWQTAIQQEVQALRDRADQLSGTITQDHFDQLYQAYQAKVKNQTGETKKPAGAGRLRGLGQKTGQH